MREYRYAPKKGRAKKGVISVLLVVGIAAGAYGIYVSTSNSTNAVRTKETEYPIVTPVVTQEIAMTPEPTIVPTVVPTQVPTPTPIPYPQEHRGDSVVVTSNVNMRYDSSKDSFKMGELPKNAVVDRIMSVDGWDLIRYAGQIAYVSTDYTRENDIDYNQEYYYVERDSDIVRTTTEVYYRLGPSKSEQSICLLGKNEELEVIGVARLYSNYDETWYLAKYKGQMGFVKAQYTRSLRDVLKATYPETTEVKIKKIGSLKYDTSVRDYNGNVLKTFNQYEAVKILEDKGNDYLVEIDSTVGLVSKDSVKTYKGTFVIVDLSEQKVYLYVNNDLVFESYCTTGKKGMETRTGSFKVSERTNSRYFSEEAQARIMWARFDGGNGFHDAPWEDEEDFGSQSFRKRSGSKGCVRLPDFAAYLLSKYMKVGTEVLVKD